MSSSSTVAASVRSSGSKIAKSSAPADPAVGAARGARRRRSPARARALASVRCRSRSKGGRTRRARTPRPARHRPRLAQRMRAERVPLEPREQFVKHALADPAAAPWRQLEPVAVALQVTSLLEGVRQPLERLEVLGRVVAEQVPHLGPVDGLQVAGAVGAPPCARPADRVAAGVPAGRARPRARGPRRRGRRTAGPGPRGAARSSVDASWARSQRRRSSAAGRPSATGARPAARRSSRPAATASPPCARSAAR